MCPCPFSVSFCYATARLNVATLGGGDQKRQGQSRPQWHVTVIQGSSITEVEHTGAKALTKRSSFSRIWHASMDQSTTVRPAYRDNTVAALSPPSVFLFYFVPRPRRTNTPTDLERIFFSPSM